MRSEVLFLGCVLLALHTVHGAPASILIGETTASTKFSATPAAPTDLIIKLDADITYAAGDRVYVYLPLFGGATNSFGTYGPSVISNAGPGNYESVQANPAVPSTNGVQGRDSTSTLVAGGLRSAYWDAPTETLRVTMGTNAATITEIFVESKFLRIGANPGGAPNGKGPRPAYAGVKDRWWYRMANVRVFKADACTGTVTGREGFPPEVCTVASAVSEQIFDIAASSKLTTSNSRLFVHPQIGEVGTSLMPYFAYSSITGSSTGLDQSNCMTFTFIPSFTFMSTATSQARIDIDGLTGTSSGSDTSSTVLSLFSSLALCEANSPSMPAGLSGFFQDIPMGTPPSVPSSNRATFDKSSGKFSMQLQAGRYIEAFQVVTFTFRLNNPAVVREPIVPRLSFLGKQCDASTFCSEATSKDVAVAPTDFILSDKVLGAEANEFKVREIWQSTTDPGVAARIHVTLAPNVNIQETMITITDLCITSSGTTVTLLSNKDNFGSRFNGNLPIEAVTADDIIIAKDASWDNTAKTLRLDVGSRGLLANKRHAFAFIYTTSATASEEGCTPKIQVGGAGKAFAAMDMEHTDFGVVDPPKFKKMQIGQSSTRPGLTNYICVTLTPNKDLGNQAMLTITGLTGTMAADSTAPLVRCPRALVDQSIERSTTVPARLVDSQFTGDQFTFEKDTGSVILQIRAGGTIRKDSEVSFAIPLQNTYENQDCKTPQLIVSGTDWSQPATDFEEPSATKRALEGGLEDGDVCPQKTYEPTFTTKAIGQSDAKAGALNTFTVTLRTNVDLVAPTKSDTHPSITIDGLFGSDTEDTLSSSNGITALAVKGVEGRNFMRISSAEWTKVNGRLVIKLASVAAGAANEGRCSPPSVDNWATGDYCIKAGFRYVFQFSLRNPDTKQAAQAPWIFGEFKVPGDSTRRMFRSDPFQYLVTPDSDMNKPLFVLDPGENDFIRTAKIGQRNPSPNAVNAICVTMSVWRNIITTPAVPGTFTISGLTGFETANNANIQMFGADGSSAVSTALTDLITSDANGGSAAANANRLRWTKDAGTLMGNFMAGKTFEGGREYRFCVNLRNPDAAQACLAPQLSVAWATGGQADTAAMERDEVTALVDYNAGSACPGFVPGPVFTLASLRHSTNVTSTVSHLYLDLAVNKELKNDPTGSKITLTGLEGFDTVDGNAPVAMAVTKDGKRDTTTFANMVYDKDAGTLIFDITGTMLPKILFPAANVRTEHVVLISFKLKNSETRQKPMKVYIETGAFPDMVKQPVVVGPIRERQDVVTLNPGEMFCYSDWLGNNNEAQGVTVKFSEDPDGASVVLPPAFPFTRSLCFGGDEVAYNAFTYPDTWQFQQVQVASSVLSMRITGNDGAEARALPLVSSLLRTIDSGDVPEYEAPDSRRRRNLLNACPEGFETRLTIVGQPADTACGCERSCGLKATCSVTRAGSWTSVLIPEAVCTAPERRPDSNAGAIVGAVLAAFFAILFGTIGYVYTQHPELFKAPPPEEEEVEEDPKAQLEEPAATRAINPPMQTQYMSPQMPSPPQPPLQQTYPAPMPFQAPMYGQPMMMGSMPPMMPGPLATPQGNMMYPMGMSQPPMGMSQPPMMQSQMNPMQGGMYQSGMSAPMVQQGYY